MRFDEFLGHVQNRARLDSAGSAMTATRATLNTLAERLRGNEPVHLAAQLPVEIGEHLKIDTAGKGERFDVKAFIDRVSERAGVPENQAVHQAQVVMGVVDEAVTGGEMEDVRGQLPADYELLFRKEWA